MVVSFEICEGYISGYDFFPALVPFATFEIPKEIRDIDGYGLYDNYLDLEKKELVIIRRINESGALPPLPSPEHIDVSQYLVGDNLIEVAADGEIQAFLEDGTITGCNVEIEFVVEGV